jgi:hypothetical protein
MKKILFLLLFLLPLFNYSQILKINGDLKYNCPHGIGSADSIIPVYTPTVTQNLYTKINTGVFVSHEADYITIQGDSFQIITAGDYIAMFVITVAGANNNQWRIKLYRNNAPSPSSMGRFVFTTTSATKYETYEYFWYGVSVPANAWFSFRITNLTNNDDPNISDYKVLIYKIPE